MFGFAGEVLDVLDSSVVLAERFAQFDADPFTLSERSDTVEADETSAYGNIDDAPYDWLGHGRLARRKRLSIRSIDRCY